MYIHIAVMDGTWMAQTCKAIDIITTFTIKISIYFSIRLNNEFTKFE